MKNSDGNCERLVHVNGDLSLDELGRSVAVLVVRDYKDDEAGRLDEVGERRLFDTANEYRDRLTSVERPHSFQIRSVPVSDFGYLLRHYFVRVDEIVDVHPGTWQKICLRGWNALTDVSIDRLETEYLLCAHCLDECLKRLWRTSKRFSFSFRNCDHVCNRSVQSIAVGVVVFWLAVAANRAILRSQFMFLWLVGSILVFVCALVHLMYAFRADGVLKLVDVSASPDLELRRCIHVRA